MLTWDLRGDGSRSTIRLTIRPVGTVTCILYLYDLRIAAGGPNVHRDGEVIGNETGEEDILSAVRGVAAFEDIRNVARSTRFDVDAKRSTRKGCKMHRNAAFTTDQRADGGNAGTRDTAQDTGTKEVTRCPVPTTHCNTSNDDMPSA